jgi:demethylmenaquinone methyltransferase / 2-methoxy-6-polyprenyl-1,4-benzoquinol methylase
MAAEPSPAAERTADGVRRMFDRVAPRYDLANTVFSLGQDRAWRQAAARAAGLAGGQTAVDVACGTGALTRELAASTPGTTVFGVDFSWEMVRRAAAAQTAGRPDPPGPVPPEDPLGVPRTSPALGVPRTPPAAYLVGDAMRLPLRDASVDVVTIAFGLRNLPEPGRGLLEFRRVLRPGGRLVVCEFSQPVVPVLRGVYRRYLTRLMPLAARRLTSDPEAYQYLARSIGAWPDQPGLAAWLQQAGFTAVAWRDLTGGIVALHRGTAGS